MKTILVIVAIFATASVQNSFAQDSTKSQTYQLLHSYYDIKNALVAGNANTASISAEQFVKATNGIDYKVISEGNINALLKDATAISESKALKEQRVHFANLSTNMFTIAKAVKLTTQSVYYTYCPMKKAYWLSNEAAIKNPYFGSAMPTCGKVVEILK
jgi:hypothetical protein